MLPRVTIDGRVAADPELRFGQSGTAVAKLRLVSADRKRDDSTGEWSDGDTLWIDVACFKQLAENVVESVAKGDMVLIHGKLHTEEWTDRDSGAKRSKISMIADSVAVSLQFRTVPHGSGQRAAPQQTFNNPVQAAYPGGTPEDPPF